MAARLERLISIKTKEYQIWSPLWKRSIGMLMFLCICKNLNGKRALVAYKKKQTKSACFERCTFTRRTLLRLKDTSIGFKDTLKAWFPYRCICRVCRTKKIHRTDRIHSISYKKLHLSFLLYWAFVREVSIKLYLSYEFFSYDRHDRYDDMETRLKGNLRNMLTPYPWNSHAASKTRQEKTMTSFQSIDSFYFKITSLLDKATCQSHNW